MPNDVGGTTPRNSESDKSVRKSPPMSLHNIRYRTLLLRSSSGHDVTPAARVPKDRPFNSATAPTIRIARHDFQ
jgi:hypothetical protein